MDLDEFVMDYGSQGEAAFHPALMLRTIVYGLTHGIVSGLKLAQSCRYDARFIFLSGEQMPDARTLHRFLERHEKRIPALFVQVVKLAQTMGLVKLGNIAIDGSKFKANSSRHKTMSYGRMVTTLEALEIEAEATTQNKTVDPKAQKSFNDLDALPNFNKKRGMNYAYNLGRAVIRAPSLTGESPVSKGVTNHAVANIEQFSERGIVKRMERIVQAGMCKREAIEPRHCGNSDGRRGPRRGSQQILG